MFGGLVGGLRERRGLEHCVRRVLPAQANPIRQGACMGISAVISTACVCLGGRQTNQRAELLALAQVVMTAAIGVEITLITDSLFCLLGIVAGPSAEHDDDNVADWKQL